MNLRSKKLHFLSARIITFKYMLDRVLIFHNNFGIKRQRWKFLQWKGRTAFYKTRSKTNREGTLKFNSHTLATF